MRDASDFAERALQAARIKEVSGNLLYSLRQWRRAPRQPEYLRAGNGAPTLGGGAPADAVDTCNQHNILRRHYPCTLLPSRPLREQQPSCSTPWPAFEKASPTNDTVK